MQELLAMIPTVEQLDAERIAGFYQEIEDIVRDTVKVLRDNEPSHPGAISTASNKTVADRVATIFGMKGYGTKVERAGDHYTVRVFVQTLASEHKK
jgi:hypothetical protein